MNCSPNKRTQQVSVAVVTKHIMQILTSVSLLVAAVREITWSHFCVFGHCF